MRRPILTPWPLSRTALAALAAVALVTSALPAQAETSSWPPLRILTYNVHAGAGADERLDLARTADAIRRQRPDVVGLQEVDVHWSARSQWRDEARELAEAVGMRAYFAPIYDLEPASPGAPRRRFGVAILTRHPILYAVNHHITRLSSQVPRPVPAPAPGFPEVLVSVRGVPLRVFNTHLDYRADPAVRTAQVADMLRIMGDRPRSVLLGDLNAPPDAPELAPLLERLRDSWAAQPGPGDGLTFPAGRPDRRIDYVLTGRGLAVRRTEVPVEPLASDHRPLLAELSTAPWDSHRPATAAGR